jgi:hypothetical protein
VCVCVYAASHLSNVSATHRGGL